MSPRDNRPLINSPAASTQSQFLPSTSTNNQQAAIAAVVSNLADSIDTAADHFSPHHTANPLVLSNPVNQPPVQQGQQTTSTIASSAVTGSIQIEDNLAASESNQAKVEPSLLMNDTIIADSVGKNTLFGYDMPFDVISAGYATLVATGGIIGYLKAGSIPSLAAGLTFGGILGIGAYMTSVNPDNYYLTLATSTGLGGLMGYRFINSGKFMPAGLIALLSIGMVARIGIRALTSSGTVPHVKE